MNAQHKLNKIENAIHRSTRRVLDAKNRLEEAEQAPGNETEEGKKFTALCAQDLRHYRSVLTQRLRAAGRTSEGV